MSRSLAWWNLGPIETPGARPGVLKSRLRRSGIVWARARGLGTGFTAWIIIKILRRRPWWMLFILGINGKGSFSCLLLRCSYFRGRRRRRKKSGKFKNENHETFFNTSCEIQVTKVTGQDPLDLGGFLVLKPVKAGNNPMFRKPKFYSLYKKSRRTSFFQKKQC